MHNAPIEGHHLQHQNYLSPRGPAAPFSPIQMTSSSSTSWLHRSNGGNVAPLQPPSTKPSIGAPLLGCIFFLDMANDDARKLSTERQLKQLAARVEDLFNGDVVTHVITTRHLTHEQKLKIQQQALSTSTPAFLPVASTPGLSSPSLLASPHPSSSSQAMTVPPFASTHQSLTTSTSTSSTSTLLSPSTLGISNATASTSPNSPFSSSPSSPFSCNPAAGSYPPPQASSSPSSPSAMAAYAPPSTAGGASLRPPTPGLPAPTAPHSLIEQLRYASGSGKRKESQLAMTRKAYMVAHQQQQMQATDIELSEDVIALAYRLGKKIYHIDKFAPWLEKHCSPYGPAMTTTTTTTSMPRRGNESTHTTAESPIGSPQGQRNLSTNCQSTAAGPAWSAASVDMQLPSLSAVTAAAPFAPVMVVPSLPPFPSGLPGSSATAASTTGVMPTTTTTKPPSPTALPSFQAPFLMVEDLKGQFKTMYKEFPFDSYGCSTVPFLNLDAPPGCSPFLDAETIKKHKVKSLQLQIEEMQRQYQQKLEQRKREKPAAGRPKRPTSAPLTRPRRPSPRERSSPQAAMQESVEMWEGEDGGGMADSSLQVPHPFRAPTAANPIATSPGSGLALYPPSTSSSSSVVSLSSSSSSSMYQQRRLSPLSSLSASTPYCPMSSTRTSPTFAFPPLHSSAPSFNTTGTPRPSKMSSSGGSHQHIRAHSHSHGSLASSASLLARAHYPSDWRERLSASCLPPDSSGRSLGEEMEDDTSTSTFMQRSA